MASQTDHTSEGAFNKMSVFRLLIDRAAGREAVKTENV